LDERISKFWLRKNKLHLKGAEAGLSEGQSIAFREMLNKRRDA